MPSLTRQILHTWVIIFRKSGPFLPNVIASVHMLSNKQAPSARGFPSILYSGAAAPFPPDLMVNLHQLAEQACPLPSSAASYSCNLLPPFLLILFHSLPTPHNSFSSVPSPAASHFVSSSPSLASFRLFFFSLQRLTPPQLLQRVS